MGASAATAAAAASCLLAARPALAAEGDAAGGDAGGDDATFSCPSFVDKPPAPLLATEYNGIAWPEFCFEPRGLEEHFFIIGDWGGLFRGPGVAPIPAFDSRGGTRPFVVDVDDRAQLLVAAEMKRRAVTSQPRYVLNVGDNFYWGGVECSCGGGVGSVRASTLAQWQYVFEEVYDGPDLLGKPWLGVLGNHDFGGFMFTKGWDQAIAYTWGDSDRWLTPALYWSTKVRYEDFSIDYFFVDSNVNDAFMPMDVPGHNICSQRNNPDNATCASSGGPSSPLDCTSWFAALWDEQVAWMDSNMPGSTADWLIVVTHFPPQFQQATWRRLAEQHGIDLIVTGHRHHQEVSQRDPATGNAAWVVCGGGGGITSDGVPDTDGNDDMYGFMDVAISKDQIRIESISHSGIVRLTLLIDAWRLTTSTTSSSTGPTGAAPAATSEAAATTATPGRALAFDFRQVMFTEVTSGAQGCAMGGLLMILISASSFVTSSAFEYTL